MAKAPVFDRLVTEMLQAGSSSMLLEDCMSLDFGAVEKVPVRYRLIALGFVRGMSLEEIDAKLRETGCAELYSRSLWEASLIYAFLHRLTYGEWKELEKTCIRIREEQDRDDPFFPGGSISMNDLKAYLDANSDESDRLIMTRHLTHSMEEEIKKTGSEAEFIDFLRTNIRSFSNVREKTRYYFCKYLYYFLLTRMRRYLDAMDTPAEDEALEAMSVFKGLSKLKRKKYTREGAEELLMGSAVSCGEIFDALNYFYFEYVSLDWMEVQLEYYGNIDALPEPQKKKLAGSLRRYRKDYADLDDAEILKRHAAFLDEEEAKQDEIYSLEGEGRGYQRNRSGENAVRKFLKGTLDPDRTTLTCFLLFFGSEADVPADQRISPKRLSDILIECGFSGLREEDDFDYFVIRYLNSEDPVTCLMEEVTRYALSEENFYLYHMYSSSDSYEAKWLKLMGI